MDRNGAYTAGSATTPLTAMAATMASSGSGGNSGRCWQAAGHGDDLNISSVAKYIPGELLVHTPGNAHIVPKTQRKKLRAV